MTARKAAGEGGAGSARAAIRAAVNSAATEANVQAMIDELFDASVAADAVCPSCGETMRVQVKDAKKIVDSLSELLTQSEGRPEQRSQEAVSVVIERPAL